MNGHWQKVAIALIMLIVGTVGASGYMSCQYSELHTKYDAHVGEFNAHKVTLEGRLSRIETLLKEIKEDIRK